MEKAQVEKAPEEISPVGDFQPGNKFPQVDQISGGRQAEYLYHLQGANQIIQIRVLRRRRKTMAIYVEKDTPTELRVPTNCAWEDIHTFLESRFDWIVDAQKEVASRITEPPNIYGAGGQVRYMGALYELRLLKSRFGVVDLEGDRIFVSCARPEQSRLVEKQVLEWYRREAERVFSERISVISKRFPDDRQSSGLVIRKMKSRWGSCSSQGEICLNLLLIRESLPQIDFVIAHELCHLRHFAHNKAFYGLLDSIEPNWRELEKNLGRAA